MRAYTRWLFGLFVAILLIPLSAIMATSRMTSVAWQGDFTPTPTDVSTDAVLNAYFREGERLMCLGEYEAAFEVYTQAIEYDPTFESAYQMHVNAYIFAHLPNPLEQIERDANNASRHIPKSGIVYLLRGTNLLYYAQYVNAVVSFSQAIELLPVDLIAEAYQSRGTAYSYMGNQEQAIEDLNHALELEPDNASFRATQVELYRRMGNFEDALVLANIGYEYMLENIDHACAYERYFNATLMVTRAWIYMDMGDPEAAIQDYTAAIEQDITYSDGLEGRSEAYLRLRDYENALKDSLAVVEVTPDNYAGYILGIHAYIGLKDYEGAIELGGQCILAIPDVPYCYFGRALAHWELGNQNAAITDLDQAIAIDPNYADAVYHRGIYHYQMQHWEAALTDLHTYQALMGDAIDPQVLEFIQQFEEALGR